MRINYKNFIPLSLTMFLLVSVVVATPTTTYAAWWNPFSWFSKRDTAQEQSYQLETPEGTPSEVIGTTPNEGTAQVTNTEKQQPASPSTVSSDSQDAETIAALKAEVASLRASLDTLYASHNRLIDDHNALLEYTKSIVATNKTTGSAINSTLDIRVSDLEKKLNDACAQIFSSIGTLSSNRCPTSQFQIKESLESRIKKLEGGY